MHDDLTALILAMLLWPLTILALMVQESRR